MPAHVLGILLVCYSSRGHQLVFAYPPGAAAPTHSSTSLHRRQRLDPQDKTVPRVPAPIPSVGHHHHVAHPSTPASQHQHQHHQHHQSQQQVQSQSVNVDNIPSGHGSYHATSTIDIQTQQQPLQASAASAAAAAAAASTPAASTLYVGKESFAGFDTHFLSDVLSPKVALCDKEFRLTVDNVTFVGHPTLLHADRPGTGHRFARMIQRKRLPRACSQPPTTSTPATVPIGTTTSLATSTTRRHRVSGASLALDTSTNVTITTTNTTSTNTNNIAVGALRGVDDAAIITTTEYGCNTTTATNNDEDDGDAAVCADQMTLDVFGVPWSAAASSMTREMGPTNDPNTTSRLQLPHQMHSSQPQQQQQQQQQQQVYNATQNQIPPYQEQLTQYGSDEEVLGGGDVWSTLHQDPPLIYRQGSQDSFVQSGIHDQGTLTSGTNIIPGGQVANNMNNSIISGHGSVLAGSMLSSRTLDRSLHQDFGDLRYYEQQYDISKGDERLGDSVNTHYASYQQNSAYQLTMFNLVFAVEPGQDDTFSDDVMNLYIHVISKLTAALKHEQLKRGYIRKEAELILAIKEDAQASYSLGMTQDEVMGRIMRESSLANCLAHLYECIVSNVVCHLVINNSVDLSLQVPDMRQMMNKAQESSFQSTLTQSEHTPVIRPYHALLLLFDPEEVLKWLPLDPTPLLIDLIRIVTPSHSFEELHTILDCSLAQLYKLAAHLVHWKIAQIIDVVSVKNVYVLHTEAELTDQLINDFSERYPQLPGNLPETLAELSMPTPFSSIIPRKDMKTLYLEVLTFLLRNKLVSQLHMYVFLLIPGKITIVNHAGVKLDDVNDSFVGHDREESSMTGKSTDIGSTTDLSESTVGAGRRQEKQQTETEDVIDGQDVKFEVDYSTVADATYYEQLTPTQHAWLQFVAKRMASKSVSNLFLRLIPYFLAKIHVEEILFRENIRRADLKLILVAYRPFLRTALLP